MEEDLVYELEQTYEALKKERDNLYKAIDVHKKLTHELINDGNLQSFANVLYDITQIPVIIENDNFDTLKAAGLSQELAECYSEEMKKVINDNSLFGIDYLEKKEWMHELKDLKRTVKVEVSMEHKRLISPILLRHNIKGYCSFLCQGNLLTDIEVMILEQAASACSLYLLNEQTSVEAEKRIHGLFFVEILSKMLNKKDIIKRGHYIGIDLEKNYYIIVINYSPKDNSIKEEMEFNDKLVNTVSKYFKENELKYLICQKSGNIVILLSDTKPNAFSTKHLCRMIENELRSLYFTYNFIFGISSISGLIEEVSNLYEEALIALKAANKKNNIFSFESLGIVGVLFQLGNKTVIQEFVNTILGKLLCYDRNKNSELIKTLYFYSKNGANLKSTAIDMSISITGLRYRLEKIEQLIGGNLNNPNVYHQVFLALQSLMVLGDFEFEVT